jgi:hypothetical protein
LSERDYKPEERKMMLERAKALGISEVETFRRLGDKTFDIYLNNGIAWVNVPVYVLDFSIGGYQVIKKWLSYREYEILGRPITPEEAREFTAMSCRLTALCLLQPALDESYHAVTASTFAWRKSSSTT